MSLAPFRERVERFFRVYLWLAREQLFAKKSKLILVVGLMAGGALAQGGMIAFVWFAVDHIQNPSTLGVEWLDRLLANTVFMLAFSGLCLLLISLAGAFATYSASIRSRSLARECHRQSAIRALRKINGSSSLDDPAFPESEGEIRKFVTRKSNHMGKATENLIRLAAPVWKLIVAVAFLVGIDFKLSLIIGPLFLVFVPLAYTLNSGVQRNARKFYGEAVTGLAARVGFVIRKISSQNALEGPVWSDHFAGLYSGDKDVATYFDAFDKHLLAQERVQFATSLATSALIVFALMVGGYMAAVTDRTWGMVAGFLLALMHLVNAMKSVLACVVSLSVYYPAASQYRNFVVGEGEKDEGDGVKEPPADGSGKPIRIRVKDGGEERIDLSPGRAAYFMTPVYLMDRLSVAKVIEPLIVSSNAPRRFWVEHTCFISLRSGSRTGPLRMHLSGGRTDEDGDRQIDRTIAALGLQEEIDSMPQGLEAEITEDGWASLSPRLMMAMIIGPVLADARRMLLLDLRLFRQLTVDESRTILGLVEDRYVLLVTDMLRPPRWLAEDVIEITDDRVSRIGDVSAFKDREVGGDSESVDEDDAEELEDESDFE